MDTFTVHEIAQLAEQRGYPAFASELYLIAASQALTDDGAKVLREKADHVAITLPEGVAVLVDQP